MNEPTDLGALYRSTRERLTALVRGVDALLLQTPVPACPGWDVHDVLSHLLGVVEDAIAGRLTGPPAPSVTAEQVARHRHDDLGELFRGWEELAPLFESALTERQVWPAVLDVVSHEQDIRGALDRPGARHERVMILAAQRLAAVDDQEVAIAITDDTSATPSVDGACVLRATAFEVVRLRLGRRTREQVRMLDWSGDPEPFLDRLFVFGPATDPIIE